MVDPDDESLVQKELIGEKVRYNTKAFFTKSFCDDTTSLAGTRIDAGTGYTDDDFCCIDRCPWRSSGTFQNFASGVLIILLKPFRVGDTVSTQGQEGRVTAIRLFYTAVLALIILLLLFPTANFQTK